MQTLPSSIQKYVEVWTQKRFEFLDSVLTSNHILHTGAQIITSIDQIKKYVSERFNAFPDIQYQVTDSIIQDDKYCFLWKASGTHKGTFMGIPPTLKTFNYDGVAVHKLTNEKISETWIYSNFYEILEKLKG